MFVWAGGDLDFFKSCKSVFVGIPHPIGNVIYFYSIITSNNIIYEKI